MAPQPGALSHSHLALFSASPLPVIITSLVLPYSLALLPMYLLIALVTPFVICCPLLTVRELPKEDILTFGIQCLMWRLV